MSLAELAERLAGLSGRGGTWVADTVKRTCASS